jgi:2-oxo-3-hexenedioate decarboxylase
MTAERIERAAAELLACADGAADLERLTETWPELDLDAAYRIQDRALELRLERGETLVGLKLGLTSGAKQRQMGVDAPIIAWLTDAMIVPAGDPVQLDRLIHPRVEPEIAFLMGERLAGPGVTSARALAAVRSVHAAVEIIDSRYRAFRFTLPDVVADNASAAGFVLGSRAYRPDELDLAMEACLLELDGTVVQSATGAAILGHPAEALAFAANALAQRGRALEPGWVVLAGAMTEAVALTGGSVVRASYTHLGAIALRATEPAGPAPDGGSDHEKETTR